MADRHGIGANNPPRHEAFAMSLEDVRLEAGNRLDGEPIANQKEADAIGVIISRAKQIRKDADTARKEDKEPHLSAGRQVDADYKPVLQTADDIAKAAQAPLTAWLNAVEAKQREEREAAEREAEKAREAAQDAHKASAGDIEALEQARALEGAAEQAEKAAAKAGKAKAHVSGENRAIGMRTYRVVTVTDRRAALNWIARTDPDALAAFVTAYAEKNAPNMKMDGVTVTKERRVA